jgi:hypothetical protein
MSYTIESGGPIPPRGGGGRRSKYPWRQMTIGDFFTIPDNEITLGQRHRGWRPQPPKNLRETGYKVSTRYLPDEGIRVWRIV